MKVDIAVIGAMEPEVLGLIGEMTDHKTEKVSGIEIHLGKIGEKAVAVARCGIGKVFAALCTQTLILKYSPDLIINSGVGGALASDLKTGDIIVAESLCQQDMDTSAIGDPRGLVSGINKIYFDADKRAVEILLSEAKVLGLCARGGRVATGDKFIASKADKEDIYGVFSADACEMEGCAVAQVAFVNNIPFAVVRAISDSADGEASMDYPTFLPIAARNSQNLTIALIKAW